MDRHCANKRSVMARVLAALIFVLLLGGCTGTAPMTAPAIPTAVPPATITATIELPATPAPTAKPAPTPPPERIHLRVFEAGSLMIPFAAVEAGFEAANPDIDVELEAHGSIQVIRHVTDIHEQIDVVASADHALLSMLMYHSTDPDSGLPYADWNIRFATNRMVLAYSPHVAGAGEISSDTWPEIVAQPGVRLGLADPRFDACGYRQLMVLQLAEAHYNQPRLFEDLLMGRFVAPITAHQEDNLTVIHVPEVLEPRPRSTISMRGSSVQLIPLLQSGDVDYIFEYESVAKQHGLHYVELPPEISLGDSMQDSRYATVQVRLDFQRFASVQPVFSGEIIAYGLTIPSNAPQPEAAARFVAYLLGPEGHRLMAANDHALLEPAMVDRPESLPALLRPLAESDSD